MTTPSSSFGRLLIANRGEVAVRIARAASDLGIPSVAVYAPEDRDSLHLRRANSSVALPGNGVRAYLDIEAIVQAAVDAGCDSLHPGYGFLSENPGLARRCAEAGITFIGPRPEVLDLFGDKAAARRLALEQGVPLASGSAAAVDLEQALEFFRSLPTHGRAIVKAVAGGGGRGMRVVSSVGDLPQAYADAASEAKAAFGSDKLYIEELVGPARHVEVQIAGDSGGGLVYLHDRECSLQRRHQKLVEIAPAPDLSMDIRERMQTSAIRLAKAAGVHTLCTFEFLVDLAHPGRFVFMEANPRLQVEHTVTEEVLGIDLVQAQILLAAGRTLTELHLLQRDIAVPSGYAVQLRINMETVLEDGNTRPSAGRIHAFDVPSGSGVRLETIGFSGYEPPTCFDSLLAKVIVHSPRSNLPDSIRRAYLALGELRVDGVETNIPFLQNLLLERAVSDGTADTLFVTENSSRLARSGQHPSRHAQTSTGAADVIQSDQTLTVPHGSIAVRVPVGGRLVRMAVTAGQAVRTGQRIAVVEAMKMEHSVQAMHDGDVLECLVQEGQTVTEADVLIVLKLREVQAADDGKLLDDRISPPAAALESLRARRHALSDAGRPEATEAQRSKGALTARQRIAALCDATSFVEIGGLARNPTLSKDAPADGLITGSARIDGRHVIVLAQDFSVYGGSSGHLGQEKMMRAVLQANHQGLPLVMLLDGGGHRIQDGQNSRHYASATPLFQELARISGWVPVVSAVMGFGFAANTNFSGMADLVLMVRGRSTMGLAGPALVKAGTGEDIANEALGGATIQVERHGLADLAVASEEDAFSAIRSFLGYLPSNARLPPPQAAKFTAPDASLLPQIVPTNTRQSYDVRHVIEHLVDLDSTFAFRPSFAQNLVTCFAHIEGRPVGIVANQPMVRSGTLDAAASEKSARFIALCDAYGLPLVFLVDIPGMLIGSAAEVTMLGRRSAKILFELGHITVPRVSIILRKAYGLGYLAMCGGRSFEADASLAWPTAEVCAMSIEGSVDVAYRKVYEADSNPQARRDQLIAEIRAEVDPIKAAEGFGIDDLIEPQETRARLIDILARAPQRRRLVMPPKFRAIPPV